MCSSGASMVSWTTLVIAAASASFCSAVRPCRMSHWMTGIVPPVRGGRRVLGDLLERFVDRRGVDVEMGDGPQARADGADEDAALSEREAEPVMVDPGDGEVDHVGLRRGREQLDRVDPGE